MKETKSADDSSLDSATLEKLLHLAHVVVTWTTQDTLRQNAAGYRHLVEARQDYLKARVEATARTRPLTTRDTLSCTCSPAVCKAGPRPDCMYHYGASLQPWNHRIPWNCPTYWDGCNCDDGPFYQKLEPDTSPA